MLANNTFTLSRTISKSTEIVNYAITTSIPVFQKNGLIKKVIRSEDSEKFILILTEDCYYNNFSFTDMVLELQKFKAHTILSVTVNYRAKKRSIRLCLYHYMHGKFHLSRVSNEFLTDFKKRIEKWL